MCKGGLLYLVIISFALANGEIFNFSKLGNYTSIFGFLPNDSGNELWHGIIKDCSKKVTFSCIQKNAYTYLDRTFIDRDNITVFDGLSLTRNNLDYNACAKEDPDDNLVEDTNGNDESRRLKSKVDDNKIEESTDEDEAQDEEDEEYLTPMEEITHALRKKTMKFLATRDYEIQLPRFFGEGANFKISPREIDSRGALIRIDFGNRALENNQQYGRLFLKKSVSIQLNLRKCRYMMKPRGSDGCGGSSGGGRHDAFALNPLAHRVDYIIEMPDKKQIQNKLLMTLFLLILAIKIIKLKFLFVIPFLFGVGTAKKLFLKLLLFLVPAFAHVFKLCSSYYSSHATKYHHHHHKIAHHHHHIPVPVPVPFSKPVYYDNPPPSHSHGPPGSGPPGGGPPPYILDEDFNGYDYAHPHIQYRKDIEELKEWGIEPYDEPYDQGAPNAGVIYPEPTTPGGPKLVPKFPGPFGIPPQYAANAKPLGIHPPGFLDKMPPSPHPQSLAYAGYGSPLPPPPPANRPPPPVPAVSLPVGVVAAPGFGSPPKPPATQPTRQQSYSAGGFSPQQQPRLTYNQQKHDLQEQATAPVAAVPVAAPPTRKPYDDEFYGPIVGRLDEIFGQLRFLEENCRERLVCSMYKNPALYSPHSNLVSNELSRDPQELQQANSLSVSSQRFHRYLNAARLGQDGGDCLRLFHCSINTE